MKYLIALCLCFFSLSGFGQHLELSRLKSLIGKPVVIIADSLAKKGWKVHPELSGKKDNQLYQTFSFGTLKAEQVKALAWFRIHADNGIINQLYYQLTGKEQYNLMLTEIKKDGAERKEVQDIEANQISTYYVSPEYIYQTIAGNGNYTVMVTANKQP